jgi:hypothetical protein
MTQDKPHTLLLAVLEELNIHKHDPQKMQQSIEYIKELGFTPRVLRLVREAEVSYPDCNWDYVQTIDEALDLIDD